MKRRAEAPRPFGPHSRRQESTAPSFHTPKADTARPPLASPGLLFVPPKTSGAPPGSSLFCFDLQLPFMSLELWKAAFPLPPSLPPYLKGPLLVVHPPQVLQGRF